MKIDLLISAILLFIASSNAYSEETPADSTAESDAVVNSEIRHLMLVAGSASHDTGQHEHRAGVLIMEQCLTDLPGLRVTTHFEGWPDDEAAFESADAAYFFMDGGSGHPVVQENRLRLIQEQIDQGLSFGAMHYGVEVPEDNGGEHFADWIGGYYETAYSANPIWEAHFNNLPNHPITKGVEPFSAEDEWYFSIRFRPDMVGVTPLLVTTPSDDTRDGPYVWPHGPYDHIVDRKGESEVLSWAVERQDGGRGFGFTGGHFHENWGNEDFRKYVLNAAVWLSGAEIPENGVSCELSREDLEANLDH